MRSVCGCFVVHDVVVVVMVMIEREYNLCVSVRKRDEQMQ